MDTIPAFRRPVPPAPIECYDLAHPAVPRELEGFTILHLSDQHIRRGRPFPAVIRRAARALAATPADLVVLTGDCMDRPGDERAALRSLAYLARSWRSRLGAVAIFGNHDSAAFRREAVKLPGMLWPGGAIEMPGLPLRLIAADDPEDLFAAVLRAGPAAEGMLSIALMHDPVGIYAAADLGVPILLAGHTHGGQIRPSRRRPLHSSSDLPAGLASGVICYNGTLGAISRGLGGAIVDFRLNCPPQIPLYVLRQQELITTPVAVRGELYQYFHW